MPDQGMEIPGDQESEGNHLEDGKTHGPRLKKTRKKKKTSTLQGNHHTQGTNNNN